MLPQNPRAFLSAVAVLLPAALLLAACGKSDRELRADSLAAVAAVQATRDSLNAIKVVMVDTAIAPELKVDLSKLRKTASGMYVGDRRAGSGAQADSNKWVLVDYTAYLSTGQIVDDTRAKGGEARRVLLGHKQVLPAWEEGLRGMRAGGRRIIVAPPSMAYGLPGKPGTVPEMATLVFDIELRKVY
jgi:FKBP-type peptidyl-prolyl cis-trans isomerase